MWIVSYFSGLFLAAFLMADILPGMQLEYALGSDMSSWSGPFWFGLPVTLGLSLLTLVLYKARSQNLSSEDQHSAIPAPGQVWLCSLMLLLGWFNFWLFAVQTATPLLSRVGEDVRIRGVVNEQPKVRPGWLACQVDVRQVQLSSGRSWQQVSGKVLVQINKPQHNWVYGDLIEVAGKLDLPPTAANPGQFDYRSYLAKRGVYLTLSCPVGKLSSRLASGEGNFVQAAALKLRAKLAAPGSTLFPGPEGQILNGMVLGAGGDLDPELRQAFNMSGLAHILSVSGFHVALVAALPVLLGRYWVWPAKTTFGVTTLVVICYALISGLSPPVVRSAIMVIMGLCAGLFRLPKDWGRILGLAAVLTTYPYPLVSSEPGYQLSFAATWAILALTPLLNKLMRLLPIAAPEHIQALVTVPLAALLGTWPLVAYHFNQFSLVSLPANLLLVDLAGLILILGLLMALLGLLSLSLASILQPALGLLLQLFIRAAEYFAGLPGAVQSITSPAWLSIFGYFLLLWLISSAARRASLRRLGAKLVFHLRGLRFGPASRYSLSLIGLGISLLFFLAFLWVWPASKQLQVTFLDVGEGDSIFIKTPNGQTILIDTGRLQLKENGATGYDAGEKVVLPFLRSQGVNKLNLLVLTHPHLDHFGGAASLLEQIQVERLLIPTFTGTEQLYQQLLAAAKADGVVILQGRQGQELLVDPELKLDILGPPTLTMPSTLKMTSTITVPSTLSMTTALSMTPSEESPDSHLNNQSLVIKLTYGQCSFLLTGDLQQEGMEQLLAAQPALLRADVLKVSHHGSKTGYSPTFYRAVNPRAAIVPVGPNLYGHPHSAVIRYFQQQKIPLLRTDQSGAITCWCDGQQVAVENFQQEEIKPREPKTESKGAKTESRGVKPVVKGAKTVWISQQ